MYTKYVIFAILAACISVYVGILFHRLLKQKEGNGHIIPKRSIIILGVVSPLLFCLLWLILAISVKDIGPLAANKFDYSNIRPGLIDSDNLLTYDLLNLFGFMPHAGDAESFDNGVFFMIVLLSILLIACSLILYHFFRIINEHGEKRIANYLFWGLCSIFVFACICFGHAWNLLGQLLGVGGDFNMWSILVPLIPAIVVAYQFYKITDERLFSISSSPVSKAVIITTIGADESKEVRTSVEEELPDRIFNSADHKGRSSSSPEDIPQQSYSKRAQQLFDLKSLLDAGILTKEEFETQKKSILDN